MIKKILEAIGEVELRPAGPIKKKFDPMARWGVVDVEKFPEKSEETEAFTATITLDGNPVLRASNGGTGGSHMYHPIGGADWHGTEKQLRADVRQALDEIPGGKNLKMEIADLWVSAKIAGTTLAQFVQGILDYYKKYGIGEGVSRRVARAFTEAESDARGEFERALAEIEGADDAAEYKPVNPRFKGVVVASNDRVRLWLEQQGYRPVEVPGTDAYVHPERDVVVTVQPAFGAMVTAAFADLPGAGRRVPYRKRTNGHSGSGGMLFPGARGPVH